MSQIWKLTAWQWAMVRRAYALLCLLFAAQQLGLMLLLAGRERYVGAPYSALYYSAWQLQLFVLGYLAVGLCAVCPLLRIHGESRVGYTLLTLPQPRWQLLAAQVVLCAVLLVGFLAWQLLLFALYFLPVRAISDRVMEQSLVGELPQQYFYNQLISNAVMRALLPHRFSALCALLMTVVVSAVNWACVVMHRGWRRVSALVLALAAMLFAACTMFVEPTFVPGVSDVAMRALLVVICAALGISAANLLWALRAVHNSELA